MTEYKLLKANGDTIAVGNRDQMFRFVKHHVTDGRYRIVGPDVKLHIVREQGIVCPDPDGVCLIASMACGMTVRFMQMLRAMPHKSPW